MAKYNFFISYSKDGLMYAQVIAKMLGEKGYSVVFNVDEAAVFQYTVNEAITNCDCFVPIITEKYSYSVVTKTELDISLSVAKSRGQRIIPLYIGEDYYSLAPDELRQYLAFRISTIADITRFVEQIDREYGVKLKTADLYERLAGYKDIKNDDKIADTLCALIDLVLQIWNGSPRLEYKEMQNVCKELYRLYVDLESYTGRYDDESKKTARLIIDTMDRVDRWLNEPSDHSSGNNIFHKQVYFASVAVRLLYSDRIIRLECADVLTAGEVRNACSLEGYIKKQAPFVKAYTELATKVKDDCGFSIEDILFIKETKSFIFENILSDDVFSPKPKQDTELSETDDILLSVAKFMQEGNKLFDVLQSRGIAGDFLNCLLTSYERLKNYCEVVGAKNVAADCVDRIVEIRNAIERDDHEKMPDEKAENGIKSLLGLTIKGSGNYDVFISFKSEDSDLAERIYNCCQRHLKVPFWSKRTLPQLSKSEYESAIYDALRYSRHFIVVLSDIKYLESNWIKNEMSTFHRAIVEGRKQDANFVFVVTDDVYKQIIDSKKMCLDERYCGYQIIKMSDYEDTLMSYIV